MVKDAPESACNPKMSKSAFQEPTPVRKNITQTTKIYGVNFPCLRMAFIRRVMRCTARTIQRPKLLPNLWHVIRLRVLLHGFLENVPLNVP